LKCTPWCRSDESDEGDGRSNRDDVPHVGPPLNLIVIELSVLSTLRLHKFGPFS
jgi:hypothetical protein